MSIKPLVTVIIPAFNAAAFIYDSISSVINQSYQEIDLIIVNDGSTDSTLEEILKFDDKRIRYFTISNKGQCAAANFGLLHAKGEYIKFFDSDDLMNSNHLESVVNLARENEDQLILCKWARFYSSVEDVTFFDRPEWRDASSIDWFCLALNDGADMLPVWQWLIPRSILTKSGAWDESLGLGNDFEFSSRLLMASKGVKFCKNAWVYYRTGLTTNMSIDTSIGTIMSVLLAIDKSRETIFSYSMSKAVQKAFAKKYFSWLISYYPFLDKKTVNRVEKIISTLGGVNFEYNWGWKFNLVRQCMGWKQARYFQHIYYSLRYK